MIYNGFNILMFRYTCINFQFDSQVGDWNSVHNDLEEIERALLKLGTKTSDGVLIPNVSIL